MISLELHSRQRKDGTQLIQISIIGKERRRISSEIYVKKSYFKSQAKWGRWIKELHPNSTALNLELEKLINKYKGHTSPDGKDLFFPFAKEFAEQYNNEKQKGTYDQYRAKLEKLKNFSRENLTFKEIDPSFIRRYVTHLKNVEGNKINTISVDLKKIRAILRQAVREKKISYQENPFLDFKIQTEHTYKQKLELNELQLIRDLNLKQGSYFWHARNIFLFCINCMGMRIGAALKLKSNQANNGKLFYQADKKGKMKNIDLTAEASLILSFYMNGKYIFPYLENCKSEHVAVKNKTALINKALIKIAKMAGIDKHVTTHVARHTLSKMAIDAGIDMRTLQGILGHSTVAITEHYAGDIADSKSNDAIARIFEKK